MRADCSTVGLCCVTIPWQHIFIGLLQVTVVGVLSHVTVERSHLSRLSNETVTADSGKPHCFMLCETKHE